METINVIITILGILLGSGFSAWKVGKTAYKENEDVVIKYKKYTNPESDGGRELTPEEIKKLTPEIVEAFEATNKAYNSFLGIIGKIFKKVKLKN